MTVNSIYLEESYKQKYNLTGVFGCWSVIERWLTRERIRTISQSENTPYTARTSVGGLGSLPRRKLRVPEFNSTECLLPLDY